MFPVMTSNFLTLFTFILFFMFPPFVQAQPAWWYDGQRKIPLKIIHEAESRSMATNLTKKPETLLTALNRTNDGTFYICYPEYWDSGDISRLEQRYGLSRSSADHGIESVKFYRHPNAGKAITLANQIFEENQLDCASPLWKKKVVLRSTPMANDPLFPLQWHLDNSGQCFGLDSGDISAVEAWEMSLGEGISIAVVDDGVDLLHPDLRENTVSSWHFDYVDNESDTTDGEHGTAVAGIAAGKGFNQLGIIGIAPEAGLVGLRIFSSDSDFIDEADEAAALGYTESPVDIYNNSWGPPDLPASAFDGPSPLVRTVIQSQIREGRNGLGSIYVRAAGNGGRVDDSNLDGYANLRYSIAVTSTDCTGRAANYAEPGSNILLNAPSGNSYLGIVTTDRTGALGYNSGSQPDELADSDYTNHFTGTSASAPIVSGVVALMLSVNSNLNWREVQHILAFSTDRNDPEHPSWRQNGAGFWINEVYGFGRVNAARAVQLACNWQGSVLPEETIHFNRELNRDIPDADMQGIRDTFSVENLMRVESVSVTIDIPNHGYWGDLSMFLTSPQGTRVRLVEDQFVSLTALESGYHQWTLADVLHLGEISRGDWTIEVIDNRADFTGTLVSWKLEIHGTALPEAASQFPLSCDAESVYQSQIASPAAISLGASRHGGMFQQAVSGTLEEDYTVVTRIDTDTIIFEQLAVARYLPVIGQEQWVMLTDRGWVDWNGQAAGLEGFAPEESGVALLFSGRLSKGRYLVYSGFRTSSGTIFTCPETLEIIVGE
jgi:subtilisin-like proprotein convertase family protein/subtilisin family serine protease